MLRPVAIMDRQKHIQTTEKKVCTDKKKRKPPIPSSLTNYISLYFLALKKKKRKIC
jgi:hypothetical protein